MRKTATMDIMEGGNFAYVRFCYFKNQRFIWSKYSTTIVYGAGVPSDSGRNNRIIGIY